MRRLCIGVDVDGVLANFTKAARKVCQHLFDGRPADTILQLGWGFNSIGITKAEEDQMWQYIDDYPNWWYELEQLPNTSLLHFLCREHKVIFITNRKQGAGKPIEAQTASWLYQYYSVMYPTVLLSDNKGPLCKALKVDYFIDDRDKNINEVAASIGEDKVIMNRWPSEPEFQKYYPHYVMNFDEFALPLLRGEISYKHRIRGAA